MKVSGQFAIIAVLGAVGVAGWLLKDQILGNTAAKTANTQTVAPILVQVKEVRYGTATDRIEAVGTALANESVMVTSKVPGIVERINIAEGQRVNAGQVLVQLDDRELVAELESQRALTVAAQQAYDRAIKLKENNNVSQAKVEELFSTWKSGEAKIKVLQAKVADLKVVAPFSGKIGLRRVSPGALVQPGAVITTLDDVDIIRLKLSVPETTLSNVKIGLEVEATTGAYRNRVFKGKITSIDSRVDQITRAAEIRADIPNQDGMLKPGMFMAYKLTLARRDNAVMVPEEALLAEGTRQFVFAIVDNRAIKREIKIGDRGTGDVEVLSGVKVGDKVVVGGIQKIRNNTLVRVASDVPQS